MDSHIRYATYPISILQAGNGWWEGVVLDFPSVKVEAATPAEAETLLTRLLSDAVCALLARDEYVPLPRRPANGGVRTIALPARLAAKVALAEVYRSRGWSVVGLAEQLHVAPTEARRLLDPYHPTKVSRLEEALATLGLRMESHIVAVHPVDAAESAK